MSSITTQPARSYYRASANPHPDHAPLIGSLDVDVCVVGAGITGCSAALRLRELGYSVCVLEADTVGWGASGRSGGQLIFGYACEIEELADVVGRDDAQLLWACSRDAMKRVRQRIADHRIQCDLTPGHLHAAVTPAQARTLRRWHETLARDYGYETQLVSGPALKSLLDSPRYEAALYDAASGHVHPLNYVLGLADAAARAGARIHERSAVTAIHDSNRPRVATANGEVVCDAVLICTNAYGGREYAPAQRASIAVGSYIAATAPLSEEIARALLPNRTAVADLQHILDYYRLSADHRLLFGSRIGVFERSPAALTRAMRARIERVFPQLARPAVEYLWGGRISVTRNWLPNIGRTSAGIYFANGFSAQGMTLTTLAGELLADALAGSTERFDVFARIKHRPIPPGRSLRHALVKFALTWHRLRDLMS